MITKNILVVDNDENIRSALEYRLEKEGYSVLLSGDGLDALRWVKSEHPDLIILDLCLPRLDGLGFLERLRSDADTQDIPVIVLTSLNSEENRARSFELGVAAFISKPFSLRKLVADVERIIGCEEKSSNR